MLLIDQCITIYGVFQSSVMALVDMLSVSIERLTREEVKSHSQTVVDTFVVMFDYCTVKQQGVSD